MPPLPSLLASLPPKRWFGRRRPPTRPRRSAKRKPVSVKQLAVGLPRPAWQTISWREGAGERLTSRLQQDIAFERLVDLAKLRWRIERDYQELKQELGLGHFEGRGWRGFQHHATLCIAAYGFLISERETIPPSAPRSVARLAQLELPADLQTQSAADPNRASHS